MTAPQSSLETDPYFLAEPDQIFSPGLVVFRRIVDANIERMIEIAGTVDRLRPHCKTHKMSAVIKRLLDRGITRHKAATIAECEMLAMAGAADIFLAYNPVGPNIDRVVELARTFPQVRFSVTADHPGPLSELSKACDRAAVRVGVFLDLNTGLNRTGMAIGQPARDFAVMIAGLRAIKFAGLHLYDGHHRFADVDERRTAVRADWDRLQRFRRELADNEVKVETIVAGGTPTFPMFAELEDSTLQVSPGTGIFHDAGYGSTFSDLGFQHAAGILTRVVSRPAPDLLTLDAGTKSVAADPPAGHRFHFPALPDAIEERQNEEHLILRTAAAEQFQPGAVLLGIPTHICPSSALHAEAVVIEEGRVVDRWPVTARDRRLTI